MNSLQKEQMENKKSSRRKHYRNSLRLFLIFVVGFYIYLMVEFEGVPKVFGALGGIGMVYSILGFLINAEVIKY